MVQGYPNGGKPLSNFKKIGGGAINTKREKVGEGWGEAIFNFGNLKL